MHLGPSELILNRDGSVYHLNLLPEDLADTVILVGDPNRVGLVSRYFEVIETQKQKREFITHTGRYRKKRISVLSTGIGTDNIDIVLNELDALVNIDLQKRIELPKKSVLNLIRIGTSGALQPNIPVDSFVCSEYAMGFDNVLYYYQSSKVRIPEMEKAILEQCKPHTGRSLPYVVRCDGFLFERFTGNGVIPGFTGSNTGFYGPQGRHLRLPPGDPDHFEKLVSFSFEGKQLTNFEMETSAIYGLSGLMGHRAISMNAIIANRATKDFSKEPAETIDRLIRLTLEKILKL